MLAIALFSTDIIIYIWQLSAFLLQVHTCKCALGDLQGELGDPQGERGILQLTQWFITTGSLVKIETGITLTDQDTMYYF